MTEKMKTKTTQHNFCLSCDKELKKGGTGDIFGFSGSSYPYCENKTCVRYGLLTALGHVKIQETDVI